MTYEEETKKVTNKRKLLAILFIALLIVGLATAYWKTTETKNLFFDSVCFFILFPGIVASGGIHTEPNLAVLFIASWFVDSLLVIGLVAVWKKIKRPTGKSSP